MRRSWWIINQPQIKKVAVACLFAGTCGYTLAETQSHTHIAGLKWTISRVDSQVQRFETTLFSPLSSDEPRLVRPTNKSCAFYVIQTSDRANFKAKLVVNFCLSWSAVWTLSFHYWPWVVSLSDSLGVSGLDVVFTPCQLCPCLKSLYGHLQSQQLHLLSKDKQTRRHARAMSFSLQKSAYIHIRSRTHHLKTYCLYSNLQKRKGKNTTE